MGEKSTLFFCCCPKIIFLIEIFIWLSLKGKDNSKGLEILQAIIQGQNLVWSFGDLASINFGAIFVQNKPQYLA